MILYGSWVRLPLTTRNDIAKAFNIPKTSSTHVADNRVVQDGYQVHDIESLLTISAMQEYTGSKEKDAMALFELVIAKVEGKEQPIGLIVETPVVLDKPKKAAAPKKRGRKPKLM